MSNKYNLYSTAEAAEMLGLSKDAMYYRIYRGRVPVIVIGGVSVIEGDWIEEELARRSAKADAGLPRVSGSQ